MSKAPWEYPGEERQEHEGERPETRKSTIIKLRTSEGIPRLMMMVMVTLFIVMVMMLPDQGISRPMPTMVAALPPTISMQ